MRWLPALLLLLWTTLQAADLPDPVARVLAAQGLPASAVSIFVQDTTAQEPLLAVNATTPRNPASVMKLLTTLVALETLGPAYTWKTRVYLSGNDLLLQGTGDPLLVTESLWTLLRELRLRGVQNIAGDLVLDDGYFSTEPADPAAFDGKPTRAYNAAPHALLLNFQALRLRLTPVQGRVVVTADPAPGNLVIDNAVTLTRDRCDSGRGVVVQPADGRLRLRGSYPAACGSTDLYRVVMPPEALLYGVFKTLWRELGGTLAGGWRTGTATGEPLYTLESKPLAELIRSVNKFSNNVMARQLLLTLGAERFGAPGTLAKGQQAVLDWLNAERLYFPELVLDNGSGLSREGRIAAQSLGQLLLHAYHRPLMPEFIASLPLAATDGTLRRRLKNSPLAGRLHAKTGTLDHVSALAGYLHAADGRVSVVVVLVNHPGAHQGAGQAVQDALLVWLAGR